MKLIDIYIGRCIVQQSLLVLAVLAGIFAFLNFIDQLSDLGSGSYGLLDVLRFVVLVTPRIIHESFPMASLIGTILGLSVLARHSELTVMRAGGFSLSQITGSVLKVGTVFVLLSLVIGEFVSPVTETMAQRGRAEALEEDIDQKHISGLWMRDQSTFVNVAEVMPDLRLLGIKIFEFDGKNHDRLVSLTYARSGRYDQGRWQLEHVSQTIIDEKGRAEVLHVGKSDWATEVTPGMMSVFLVHPGQLPLSQLKKYIEHLKVNTQDTRAYELAYWSKIVLPLSTAVMLVLAVPFVFSNLRAGSLGRNLFLGIMVGLGFFVLNKALGYIVLVYGVHPFVGAMLPTLLFLGITLLLYRRVV